MRTGRAPPRQRGLGLECWQSRQGSAQWFAHDLVRKPVPTFRDHGVSARHRRLPARKVVTASLGSMKDFGAGEGIRTLDPNLGNVKRRGFPLLPHLYHTFL